jgi:hypothetical protein
LLAEAHPTRHGIQLAPAGFERFKTAVAETTRRIDPNQVAIVMPASAWFVLSETLALDAESSHIDPALREEIQTALDTIDLVQLLEVPVSDEAATAFDLVTEALALPTAAVTP